MDNNVQGNYDQQNVNVPQGYREPYAQPTQGSQKTKKKRFWIWILVALILTAVVIGAVIAATGILENGQRKGNMGVWAVYDYFDQEFKGQQRLGSMQNEFSQRIINEPFEIESEFEIGSDSFSDLGIPFRSISIDIDAKYDMRDLGIKIGALGMDLGSVYLIEDDLVLDVMDQASSIPIDLPIEADLSQSMPLKDRAMAFLPFLPEDEQFFMRLLMQVAMSVPDEYTQKETADVYSPLEDKEVKMNAITTTLDADAIKQVAGNLSQGLEDDKALKNELQTMLDDFAIFFDLDVVDLDEVLGEMADVQIDESEFDEFSWSVYQKDGNLVGMNIRADSVDNEMSAIFVTESSGNKYYVRSVILQNGVEVQNADYIYTYEGDTMYLNANTTQKTESYLGGYDVMTAVIDGTYEIQKQANNEYSAIFEATIDQTTSNTQTDKNDSEISFDIGFKADCLFGNDLDTLKESKEYGDIYDMEWGDIGDLMKGLNKLGNLL